MRVLLCLLPLICACAGPERDIYFASVGDDFKDLIYGRDRGLAAYRAEIGKNISSFSGPYKYMAPAWVSQYRVIRSAYGLGGTRIAGAEDLSRVVDTLFHLLRNDPTGATRGTVCLQLGRIVMRLPVDTNDPIKAAPRAEEKINSIASDLWKIKDKLEKGQKVKSSVALELLEQLEELRVPRLDSGVQVVRACSLPPIVTATTGKVHDKREEIVPGLVRDAILVALRETACGHGSRVEPDPEPFVRMDALDVLIRLASPVARDAAAARLAGDLDAPETDPPVRVKLVEYLGVVGGRAAFVACLDRLRDPEDQSVRFMAHAALIKMTGVRIGIERAEWAAWLMNHPEWQPGQEKPPADPE